MRANRPSVDARRPLRSGCAAAFPDPLPHEPALLLRRWLDDAEEAVAEDFNAMVLATASAAGAPSARVVLCKQIEPAPPAVVFYTNYESRKGRELEANPRAAGVFYWPALKRQARVEGAVVRTTEAESDEYFRSRPLLSRLGAIASRQSQPLPSRTALAVRVARAALTPGAAARRPPSWGGFRMLLDRIELWAAGAGRLHDRVLWIRVPSSDPTRWTSTRLFP
ncbi:MAG: pyridoxamine 5'-phosphate oxidase [Phycisphaerae bacterium]|nr:pyridoxamine 5'-phosphate oxidase [Phycisphaerae bacterium]